jgi:YVTN family beta-propeller protein
MKKVILLLLFSLALAFGQWIDTIIPLPDSFLPIEICYNYRNNKIYCYGLHDTLIILDCSTYRVITSFPIGSGLHYLCYNSHDNKIYCSTWDYGGMGGIIVINGATDSLAFIPVGRVISALYYNPYNNKLYCALYNDSIVAIIDGTTDSILRRVRVGAGPAAFCYNHRNNKVYCANYESGNISVIDGVTNLLINTIPAGRGAKALCYNSINNKVYCANYRDSSITVIDGTTDSVIKTIYLYPRSHLGGPDILCYNPYNNKIYCGSFLDCSLTIINGATDSVITCFYVQYPIDCYYNSINNKIYFGGDGRGFTIINGATDSVITNLLFGTVVYYFDWDSVRNVTYAPVWYCEGYLSAIAVIRDSILPAIEEKSTSQIIQSSVLKTKENLFDITGRKVNNLYLRRGVYFLKEKEYIQKVILIK